MGLKKKKTTHKNCIKIKGQVEINNVKKWLVSSLQNLLNSGLVLVTLGCSQLPCLCCSSHWAALLEPQWPTLIPTKQIEQSNGLLPITPKLLLSVFIAVTMNRDASEGWVWFYARALKFMDWLSQTIPQLCQLLPDLCEGPHPKVSTSAQGIAVHVSLLWL